MTIVHHRRDTIYRCGWSDGYDRHHLQAKRFSETPILRLRTDKEMPARRLTANIGLGHGLHSLVHRSLLPHITTQDDDRVPEFMDNGRLLIRQPVLLDRVINASGRRRNSAQLVRS